MKVEIHLPNILSCYIEKYKKLLKFIYFIFNSLIYFILIDF